MYPDPRVADMVTRNFVPARFHIREKPEVFERFGAEWTPTILVLDPDGIERHRIEGFLPVADLLPQLELALGKVAFARKDYQVAERHFRSAAEEFPDAGVVPEAWYWRSAAEYKATGSAEPLAKVADFLKARYPESECTRKASVWSADRAA